MSISKHFSEAQQWAHTHFGEVGLPTGGNAGASWARKPEASIPPLSQGQAYASKAAYQLLGHTQATPDTLQAPHR